ncbi:MAG: GDSL family lipase [Methylocystaceae bacterium]|nr:MAG: GDSL family lipase [Methylocystaceae bacterium]
MRICFFGDSFVNGTGDDDGLGWVGRLVASARRRGKDVTSYNLGVRRDTSADVAARWADEATRRLPPQYEARLAFSFGANDCADDEAGNARLSLDASLASATAILSKAVTLAPTLMIGPALPGEAHVERRIRLLSQELGQVCARLGVPYLETHPFVSTCDVWRREAAAGDGAHPNRDGYSALAGHIGSWSAWKAWLGPTDREPITSARDAPAGR